ncbi:exo-alpha-sialidase [Arthrobacter sp. JSM 101049]|uniref:sialidase family protein n=1 Tax=Arthrobacter sp. JSM 101049 TaxID=929097 RepID=UPI00356802EE
MHPTDSRATPAAAPAPVEPILPDNPPTIAEQVLAARGHGGYRQYRIPALAVSPRGTVLAAYDGRPNLDDLPNTIDLLLRRSFDNGRTWEPQQVIRTGTGLAGYGDPSLLVDRETGRLFCFHAAGTHAGFFEAVEGLEPEDDVQHVDLSVSDDDGATWTHRRLTGMLKREGITGIFAAAGTGIQLDAGPHAGRLIQQMVILLHGTIRAASACSDDHGETWILGEPAPGEGNENKTVALPDGTVLLNSRAPGARLAARSTDGGHSYTALEPVPTLPDPGDNGSILRLRTTADGGCTLLATHNRDTALRRNTVLAASHDAGTTWEPVATLCAGSSAYSTAAVLADGALGVFFERDGYSELVFTRIEPEALTDGALAGAAASFTEDDGGALAMVLRSITPGRPEHWMSVGESHTIGADAGAWGVHTWKEIGQGYTGTAQVLGTREAQVANYGEPAPGLRAGDILAFTGRFTNTTASIVTAALAGTFDGHDDGSMAALFPPATLAPGEHVLYFTPVYTVTADDIAAGAAVVRWSVEAGGRTRSGSLAIDTSTGAMRDG